jgi:hypothetical protein
MDLPEKTAFVWTPDDLMEMPRRGLLDLGVPADKLPDEDWVPRNLEGLYEVDGIVEPLRPFSVIRLKVGEATIDAKLVLLGVVPDAPDLVYVLDSSTAEVLQLDRRSHGVRGVNSSYRWFVEFLWQLEAAKKRAGADRLADVLGPELKSTLNVIDPLAFQAGQWWPGVWDALNSSE